MAQATAQVEIQDFIEESVSTGRIGYPSQVLPTGEYDRLLPRFCADAVRQMRHDAEVHAAVEFLVDALFSDGVQFVGAQFENDPEYDESEQIKDFVTRCFFESPATPFLPTLKELGRGACYYGHKVAEVVMRDQTGGVDDGRWVLDRLKVKPNRATAFVVDAFYNVLGLIGIQKGQFSVTVGAGISAENVIPKEKFFICTLETEDSDPRGVAQIKAAFTAWLDKLETIKQFRLARRKSSVRSFIATTPEKAENAQVKDDKGQQVILNGVPQTRSAVKSTAATLARMESDTVAVFPFGTVVTTLDADTSGDQFKLAIDWQNTEIRKSILLSTQATGEPDKGGLGSGGHAVHERALGRRIASFRNLIEDQIYDLARIFVAFNYGPEKIHLTPKPSLGNFDKDENRDKRAAAVSAGYSLDRSQFDELDAEFDFPRRDMAATPSVTDPNNPDSTKGQMK